MIRGIDVSIWQATIDWAAVKHEGKVEYVYARASHGTRPDHDFDDNHDKAKAQGFPFGTYHFFEFATDGKAQADFFLQTTDGRLGTLLPALDLEEQSFNAVPGQQAAIEAISAFLARVGTEIGKRILIYTNYNTWTNYLGNTDGFSGHPLWVAQTVSPDEGLFGGWKDWMLWQDDTTTVAGITGSVDLDLLNPSHSLSDLAIQPATKA